MEIAHLSSAAGFQLPSTCSLRVARSDKIMNFCHLSRFMKVKFENVSCAAIAQINKNFNFFLHSATETQSDQTIEMLVNGGVRIFFSYLLRQI